METLVKEEVVLSTAPHPLVVIIGLINLINAIVFFYIKAIKKNESFQLLKIQGSNQIKTLVK